MARSNKRRIEAEFVLFDVVYEDGMKSSRRKVPATEVQGFEGDAPALAIIQEQDRKISEVSGAARAPIWTLVRSPGN